jgi:purine-binding chemotaxis protein CheW
MAERVFFTFYLDTLYLGIDIQAVQEVMASPLATKVPYAPAGIAGLINLRGQLATVLDLRPKLNLSGKNTPPFSLIIKTETGFFSLLVDELGEVLELDNPLPGPTRLIEHMYTLPYASLLVLNLHQTLDLHAL